MYDIPYVGGRFRKPLSVVSPNAYGLTGSSATVRCALRFWERLALGSDSHSNRRRQEENRFEPLSYTIDNKMRSVSRHKPTLLTVVFLVSTLILATAHDPRSQENICQDEMTSQLSFSIRCSCGKVKAAISALESTPPLRLVCYCKDCRGYFNTLNHMAEKEGKPPPATLDEWGGVDWTAVFPRDIEITEGKDLLRTSIIRPTSKIRQVYCSSCYTPMFRFGAMSALVNTNLIQDEAKQQVRFRIIGRDSLKGASPKPTMSWSVPFSWFWVMTKRIKKDLMTPMPLEIKDDHVEVLKDFKQG